MSDPGTPAAHLERRRGHPPELALRLGDNIYPNTVDMNVMRAKYATLATVPGFQLLRKVIALDSRYFRSRLNMTSRPAV